MAKPKIITKTQLRNNIAKYTTDVVNSPNTPLWITEDGNIISVMVEANEYSKMEDELFLLKKKLFELETQLSINQYKTGQTKSFGSVDDLMKGLENDEED